MHLRGRSPGMNINGWLVTAVLTLLASFGVAQAASLQVRVGFTEGSCEGGLMDAAVVLEPTGLVAETDHDGVVEFVDLEPGTYLLRLDPPCRSGSCWEDLEVILGSNNLSVEICAPVCGTQVFLSPPSGPPGTVVEVEGACQWIHSGGTADLFFGPLRVGFVRGETAGDFQQTFMVSYLPRGSYTVAAAGGVARFELTGSHPVCPGDCDGNRVVEIAELMRSVGIGLGTVDASTCPVFSTGVEISDLVASVRAALNGCAPLAIPSPTPVP